MSMSSPFEPHLGTEDDGIPAADPGAGAPEPADGFGIGGEEPDLVDPAQEVPAPGSGDGDGGDPPFRTPDPDDVSRR